MKYLFFLPTTTSTAQQKQVAITIDVPIMALPERYILVQNIFLFFNT
ncbi:hypothetical protein [Chitinophaga sp. HK235]|nr:hypothetical protein [Chitinophaga sp. HK235]